MTCSADECDRPVFRQGLCRGHLERKREGRPVSGELRPRGRSRREAFWDAVYDLLDVKPTDDKAANRARWRVEKAAQRWFGDSQTK